MSHGQKIENAAVMALSQDVTRQQEKKKVQTNIYLKGGNMLQKSKALKEDLKRNIKRMEEKNCLCTIF